MRVAILETSNSSSARGIARKKSVDAPLENGDTKKKSHQNTNVGGVSRALEDHAIFKAPSREFYEAHRVNYQHKLKLYVHLDGGLSRTE